ncbi:MAG TPA: aminofutalosine synthase MqnE [Thermoleophilia bacterium]|nr:aminofutalosine synthase MqnE [Thermoleophilia bacterium]HQJ97979.1 aminofutalosine synthase MqnE [Thermoleophilia bacterium]
MDTALIDALAVRADLTGIWGKVADGRRMSEADAVALLQSDDLLAIGALADFARSRAVGDDVYFIANRHINHTNVCRNRCRFCAFSHDEGDPEAFTLTVDEVVAKARETLTAGISEIHIVGGEHPDLPFDYYVELLRGLKTLAPDVHIQAFTASEVAHLAKVAGLSVEDTLRALKDAGLGSLPGGGAEVFSGRVRDLICERKISGQEWLDVMRAAHGIGLRSNATMLYGHVETPAELADHMVRLRALQDETGGFDAFIPLSFQPANTGLSELPGPTGHDDLKVLAVGRLVLDNFRHVKAFWINVGLKLAQVSLAFGVDDLDGTVVEEKISHAAGVDTGQELTRDELVRVIRGAGRTPVERDTLYNVVRRYDD